jgi:hypothetical protein
MLPGRSLENDAKLNVIGLVVAATGIGLEIAAGSRLYPTLALPIVLLIGAAVVAFGAARWTRYVGLVIPLLLAVGLAISVALSPAFIEQLTDIGNFGTLVGSLLHVVGLVLAVAGGIRMVLRR